jgi:hypothetical protein
MSGLELIASRHCLVRMQQRGISADDLQLLERYGRRQHDGRGGVIFFFDKRSRQRLANVLGDSCRRSLSRILDTYMVESASDGTWITTGHRYRRILRK